MHRSVALSVCLLLQLGCARKAPPCQAPPDCDEAHECLAFRCVAKGGEPVPQTSDRLVLSPARLAGEGIDGVPGYIALGAPARGALYLRFDLPPVRCSKLHSAFLLLDAPERGQSLPEPVALSVRRVTGGWDPGDIARGDLPDEGLPEAKGLHKPPTPGRVDVTSIVCHDLETPSSSDGVVVRADGGHHPVRISTGIAGGNPPRLELYIANESPETAGSTSKR